MRPGDLRCGQRWGSGYGPVLVATLTCWLAWCSRMEVNQTRKPEVWPEMGQWLWACACCVSDPLARVVLSDGDY